MCTAVSLCANSHYFGRNLDLEHSYQEAVTVVPRNFPLPFRQKETIYHHYAMIGMAITVDEYPLLFDATNEKGLSMAGLNFPGNAYYFPVDKSKDNITPFEFIPWILSQCITVTQAEALLKKINICNISFNADYPLSPLHWIISDKDKSIVVESVKEGLNIYDDPIGVLTNNPPFDYHLYNLSNYLKCTSEIAQDHFSKTFNIEPFSKGMGAIGLPGDYSSASRFVKAAFVKGNTLVSPNESENICAFFRILDSVAMPNGCVETEYGYETTLYSSCCDTDRGIYYYTTQYNRSITAINLYNTDLNTDKIKQFPLRNSQNIFWEKP